MSSAGQALGGVAGAVIGFIVGGGPVGLSMAILLQRFGIDFVRTVDKAGRVSEAPVQLGPAMTDGVEVLYTAEPGGAAMQHPVATSFILSRPKPPLTCAVCDIWSLLRARRAPPPAPATLCPFRYRPRMLSLEKPASTCA